MKMPGTKHAPVLIVAGGLLLVCLLRVFALFFPEFNLLNRLEWITYDWRVRQAALSNPVVENRFAFVAISDDSIQAVNNGSLGYQFGLYWPRQIYGSMLRELTAQGCGAVLFDVLFAEVRPDHPSLKLTNGKEISSDEFFARQLRASKVSILAGAPGLLPAEIFLTNAAAVGSMGASVDADGVLRRTYPFVDFQTPNPLLAYAARIEPRRAVFELDTGTNFFLPIDPEGFFSAKELRRVMPDIPLGVVDRQPAKLKHRLWSLGIQLAAQHLQLDLSRADIFPDCIVLRAPSGLTRTIPLDSEGTFYINWTLVADNTNHIRVQAIEQLLDNDLKRAAGQADLWPMYLKKKLVLVGSTATGNGLTDRGATSLDKDTFLVSKHWNVARAVLDDEFVRPLSWRMEVFLVVALGILTALLTWRLGALASLASLAGLLLLYVLLARWFFLANRLWLPLVLPVLGGMVFTYLNLISYRVIFEQKERRRVKGIFAKIVSPDVVNELLNAERLSLGGARRNLSVYFADVRGFTEMTDTSQAKAEDYVQSHRLDPIQAELFYDQQAREMLSTVNLYLGTVAKTIKDHKGTLDKYIGDCVMAFWGAPTPNERHAVDCVQAAIDAQRAIYALNLKRAEENKLREQANQQRVADGLPPLPQLSLLSLGSGVNSGVVVVGLMGSDDHILNYTVFGREVNLASRLEGVSGRGRIIIGEATFRELQQHAPELAETCVAQPAVMVKGIRSAVKIYEVPWRVGVVVSPSNPPPAST
jgi:class 3 adenylate cyclase/CHASE2 domain-containing sensor protein